MALNIQSNFLPLFLPHLTAEIWFRVQNFILSVINEESCLLHLCAKLSHHNRRLGLVLVSLNHPLILLWVVVRCLVCLTESVMILLACSVVPESTVISLLPCSLFYLDCDDLDLVVSQSDLHFEHVGHHELVRFNRVKVVFLLVLYLLSLSAWNVVHLIHHLLVLLLLPSKRVRDLKGWHLHLHVLLLLLLIEGFFLLLLLALLFRKHIQLVLTCDLFLMTDHINLLVSTII